jgi:hypothetical protein
LTPFPTLVYLTFPAAAIRYYPNLSDEKEVKRRLERELMLRKVFEPDRFAGRAMLACWDGVWYAVRGQEVVVPARRVVMEYVETGETEEMSYRAFCKVPRKQGPLRPDPTQPAQSAQHNSA